MLTYPKQLFSQIRHRISSAIESRDGDDLVLMMDFVRRSRASLGAARNQSRPVAILISPWVHPPVPFFTAALGLALRARGENVLFVSCPDPTGASGGSMELVRNLMNTLAQVCPCESIENLAAPAELPPAGTAAVAQAQLIWESRAADFPGIKSSQVMERVQILHPAVEKLLRVFQRVDARAVLLPGGFVGASGAALVAAESLGLRVVTYDSGPDELLFSANGIAAQHADFPASIALLADSGEDVRAGCVEWAKAEYGRRTKGSGAFQPVPTGADLGQVGAGHGPPLALIPLNVEWDAAALRTHRVFDTAQDWLRETVSFLLSETPAQVIVRQHPHERLPGLGSKADYRGILGPSLAHPRLRFVAAAEPVNTYDLLARSTLVLPKASTTGIEAAALGHHVVVEAQSYYAAMPYVERARSAGSYKDMIQAALRPSEGPSAGLASQAWLSLYLTQKCGFAYSKFNPHQASFQEWVKWDIEHLLGLPEVQDMSTSVTMAQPFLWLVHQRHLRTGLA